MSAVKIAITCACGPLHKWGYQWTANECIGSQAEFADHVYLVQSTADATGVKELLDKYPNITLISSPETWHHRPGVTDEILEEKKEMGSFTYFHQRNLGIGRLAAFRDGYKIVMSTHSNWYIPRQNYASLRNDCHKFLCTDNITGYGWALAQLHNKLVGPPVRRETLCNMTGMTEKDVSVYYPDMKARHVITPNNVFSLCLIDASYNVLPEEFGGMQKRFYYPGYETWEYSNHRQILIERFRRFGSLLNEPLDYWGQCIANKSTPDFMGYQLLEGLNDYPRYD